MTMRRLFDTIVAAAIISAAAVSCTGGLAPDSGLMTKSAASASDQNSAGFLFRIDADGVQTFVLGQTRTYAVTRKGVSATTVVAPDGWFVKLSETQISITAPHTAATKSAVITDSGTDVSVIAVSEQGYVTMAKVTTELDVTQSVDDPFATLTLGNVGAYSAEVNVEVQNHSEWFWMLKESSETAPEAADLKEANAGSDSRVTLSTEPETNYTFYVLPVSGKKNGKVAKLSFTTTAVTSYYEAWEAGREIKVGSRTYSKANNGKAMFITGNKEQQIYDAWVNKGNYGIFFIDEGSSAFFNNAGYTKPVIVIGNVPGTRPAVKMNQNILVIGTDLAFRNVSVEMADGVGKMVSGNQAMGRMVLEDCRVDLKYPLLNRYSYSSNTGDMEGVEILDCDVLVDWASDNNTEPFLITAHVGGSDCGDLTVRNNVFWSASGKKEFHLCASQYSGTTKFGAVVLRNNTFYNLNNGKLSSSPQRDKALIRASSVGSFYTGGNIFYDSAPVSKNVADRPHFTLLYAGGMTVAELQAATTAASKSLINIAENCYLKGTDGADWNAGLTSLIKWKDGSSYKEIDSWTNPFKSEDAETGKFVTTNAYSEYGAQRK